MKLNQVAAQLYTVRDFCQTGAALAATAKKIRALGYPAVQLSGHGPIPAREIAAIMAGEGLTICATHEPSAVILDQPEKAIATLQELGCRLTAYPYPGGVDFSDAGSITTLVRKLDAAGARFRAAGLTLGYHNHDLEFLKFQDAPVLDYIFAHTDPRNLVGELDTYWIQYGGGDWPGDEAEVLLLGLFGGGHRDLQRRHVQAVRFFAEDVLAGGDGGRQVHGVEVGCAGDHAPRQFRSESPSRRHRSRQSNDCRRRPPAWDTFVSTAGGCPEYGRRRCRPWQRAARCSGVHGVGGRPAAPAAAADQADLDHVAAGGMDAPGERHCGISGRAGGGRFPQELPGRTGQTRLGLGFRCHERALQD